MSRVCWEHTFVHVIGIMLIYMSGYAGQRDKLYTLWPILLLDHDMMTTLGVIFDICLVS